MDVAGEGVDLDVLEFFQILDLLQELLDAYVLVVLILKKLGLQTVQLVLSKHADVVDFLLVQHAEVEVALFQLLEVLFQRLAVLLLPEPVLYIDFVEVGDHVLGLVLRVVDLFDAVENYCEDYFVRQDAGVVQKVAIALLDALVGEGVPLMVDFSMCLASL